MEVTTKEEEKGKGGEEKRVSVFLKFEIRNARKRRMGDVGDKDPEGGKEE